MSFSSDTSNTTSQKPISSNNGINQNTNAQIINKTQPNYDALKQYIPTTQQYNPNQIGGFVNRYPTQLGFSNINYVPIHRFIAPPFQLTNQNIGTFTRQSSQILSQQPTPTEQDILDNGFMDLFQKRNSSNVQSNSSTSDLKPPSRPAPKLPINENLIDLDIVKDKAVNILELFDPLAEKPVSPPPPPIPPKIPIKEANKKEDNEVTNILIAPPGSRLKKRNSLNLDDATVTRVAATRVARKGISFDHGKT
jgi:hypothetical protein